MKIVALMALLGYAQADVSVTFRTDKWNEQNEEWNQWFQTQG